MSAVSVSESGMRPILADAVDLARRALLELEPVAVGAYLGVIAEDESSATHRFEATLPGYRGWQWAVVVAAPPEADYATVSESALLPGPDALVAPDFVPWEQRIRPGDLAPGDLLAPPADDPRLAPGYVATGDPVVDEVAYELGLGRTKVLSKEGREEAAERWYTEHGPGSEMAKSAPATCGTCGFYLPLAGSLRAAFGVCGNAMGADGRVVHIAYGCGAHSDTVMPSGSGSPLHEAYDDAAIDMISMEPERAAPASPVAEQDSTELAAGTGEHPAAPVASAGSGAVADRAEDVSSATEGVAVADSSAASAAAKEESAEPGAEPTAVDAPASEADHTAVPGESDEDESSAVTIDTDSAADTAERKSSATDVPDPIVADESGQAPVDTPSATGSADAPSTSAPTEAAIEPATDSLSTPVEWAVAEPDSIETNAAASNAAGPSAVESDAADPDPADSVVAGTDAVQSAAPSTAGTASEPAASAPSAAEPTTEATEVEEAGAQAGSGIEPVGEAEARPEFPSSPRS
ncbi:DUF3027 domain-containing protein [Nocardia sp. NBC_00508]|uniref:DUF3027 domain-containing protein n=1 Tax=Nocardia sp. NBC_00508 TaxID=2975992 RepID=UPI003FA56723